MEASNPAHNGSGAFTAEGSVRREGGPLLRSAHSAAAVSPCPQRKQRVAVGLTRPCPTCPLCHQRQPGLGSGVYGIAAGQGWSASGSKRETASTAFPAGCGTGRAQKEKGGPCWSFPWWSRGSCCLSPFLANHRDTEDLLMGRQERPSAGSLCW